MEGCNLGRTGPSLDITFQRNHHQPSAYLIPQRLKKPSEVK